MRYETIHVCINDDTIAQDPWRAIEPIWWTANIYDGPEQYELSLVQFSRSQRRIFAVLWYRTEVNNGGHHQFYSNSTGIVWKDALSGFQALEVPAFAEILAESAARLGGSPSMDRDERSEQLDRFAPDFEDLDDRFYEVGREVDLDDLVLNFIRARSSDFHFEGKVRRAVLPNF